MVKSITDIFIEHLLYVQHCIRGMVVTEVIQDMAVASQPRELSLSCLNPLIAVGYGFSRGH